MPTANVTLVGTRTGKVQLRLDTGDASSPPTITLQGRMYVAEPYVIRDTQSLNTLKQFLGQIELGMGEYTIEVVAPDEGDEGIGAFKVTALVRSTLEEAKARARLMVSQVATVTRRKPGQLAVSITDKDGEVVADRTPHTARGRA